MPQAEPSDESKRIALGPGCSVFFLGGEEFRGLFGAGGGGGGLGRLGFIGVTDLFPFWCVCVCVRIVYFHAVRQPNQMPSSEQVLVLL